MRLTLWFLYHVSLCAIIDKSNSTDARRQQYDFPKIHILCKLTNREYTLKLRRDCGGEDLRMSSMICLPIRYTHRLFDLLRGRDREIQQHLRFEWETGIHVRRRDVSDEATDTFRCTKVFQLLSLKLHKYFSFRLFLIWHT